MRRVSLAALLLAAGGCEVRVAGERTERIERRFAVSAVPSVRLSTFDGSIDVRSWDRAEALVEVETRAMGEADLRDVSVRAEQRGGRIEVECRRAEGRALAIGFGPGPSARIVATLPRAVRLYASTGDGAVSAAGLEGRIELRTGDGSVRAQDVAGELVLRTGDGSVRVEDAEGTLRVVTGDGAVAATGRFTGVAIESGDGSVTLRAAPGSRASRDWRIVTGGGGIVVYLPEDLDAAVEAETGDGRVRTELAAAEAGAVFGRRLSLTLGRGGRLITLRTGDGSIALRRW